MSALLHRNHCTWSCLVGPDLVCTCHCTQDTPSSCLHNLCLLIISVSSQQRSDSDSTPGNLCGHFLEDRLSYRLWKSPPGVLSADQWGNRVLAFVSFSVENSIISIMLEESFWPSRWWFFDHLTALAVWIWTDRHQKLAVSLEENLWGKGSLPCDSVHTTKFSFSLRRRSFVSFND